MIVGIGSDIVEVSRIEQLWQRFGLKFSTRILNPNEQKIWQQRNSRNTGRGIFFLATRFAAKEAFAKAMGSGIGALSWQDMEVQNSIEGLPRLICEHPIACETDILLSLSDEKHYVVAFVIIQKKPAKSDPRILE